jgi:hypothetical protein
MMFLPSSAWKRPPAAETKPRVVIHLPPQPPLALPHRDTGATPRTMTATPAVAAATPSH